QLTGRQCAARGGRTLTSGNRFLTTTRPAQRTTFDASHAAAAGTRMSHRPSPAAIPSRAAAGARPIAAALRSRLRDNASTLTVSTAPMIRRLASARRLLPGLLLSSLVALAATNVAPLIAGFLPIPAMVIALIIGIALNPLARRPSFQPGIVFCLKTVLRWAVALLGLRIALGDIAALGLTAAGLTVIAMAATLAARFLPA